MKVFILLALVAFSILYAYKCFYGSNNSRRNRQVSSDNIRSWMQMSRADRNACDEELKKLTMERKKKLIEDIRKEYKNLK